jgi:hypothetical protein
MVGAAPRVAALFSRGKLTSMPRAGVLRTQLLQFLARRFEPGRAYTENELREELQPVYNDHVALRRHLVDEGILVRDNAGVAYRVAASADRVPV